MKKVLFSANVYRHLTAFHMPYMRMLLDKGFEVYAIANEDYGGHREKLEEIGVKTIDVPINRNPFSFDNAKSLKIIKNTLRTMEFDIVHVHTPIAAFLTRLAKPKNMKGKLIYSAHGFHFFKGAPLLNWLLYFPLERITAPKTDLLITTNNEDTVTAKKLGFTNENLIHIKGVGVEIDNPILSETEKENLRQELGIKQNDKIIICAAEMNDNKNQMFLLRNWNKIKMNVPNAVLLFAGRGPNLGKYEEYKNANGLKGVYFLGFRNDIPNLLQITDIMTLLSQREGLPKSIMEGMSQGLPCIVSDTRGLVDLVDDNYNGYVIEKGNDESLVYAFTELLTNDALRNEMGHHSKLKVESFTLDAVMKDYKQVYFS